MAEEINIMNDEIKEIRG